MTTPASGPERGKVMGELRRGARRWEVRLETEADPARGLVRGRLHFRSEERVLSTGWIFLEAAEKDVAERFGEFSPVELWHFVEALDE